ncbi:MAG: hypothetical protein AAB731_02180 [Patescibacteria group bacterium]
MRRVLVVCLFLVGCNISDESFEEMSVGYYEDGARAKVVETDSSRTGMLKAAGKDTDGLRDIDIDIASAKDRGSPCVKYEAPDPYTEGCYTVFCEEGCSPAQAMRWPPCGISYCLPRTNGWTDPGYPIPFAE